MHYRVSIKDKDGKFAVHVISDGPSEPGEIPYTDRETSNDHLWDEQKQDEAEEVRRERVDGLNAALREIAKLQGMFRS